MSTAQKTSGNQGTLTGVFNAILSRLKNGPSKTFAKTITRPSNGTTYAVGDVIAGNGVTTMEEIIIGGTGGWIVGGQSVSSVAQSTLQYDCYFFKTSFPHAVDNSPFAPTDDQLKDNYLGRLNFSSFFALSANSVCDGSPASTKPIAVPPKFYMVRVATTAYAPGSGEQITDQLDFNKT